MTRQSITCLATLVLVAACASPPDPAAEEQTIRNLSQQWVQAVADMDTAAIANFYAEGAYFMPPNTPWARGRDAIASAWWATLQPPNLSLSIEPSEVGIAAGGDMAYDIGTVNLAFDGPAGRIEFAGKYVVVWQKVDGEWKAVADMFNSNNPAM